MFTSLSAKVQDFEWFMYKSARKTVLDNHHKEYDLELTKGLKFGIRMFRRKLRLVVSDDISISFTISELEAKRIKKKAEPFKGKINGVVVHVTERLDDSLYHDLNLPPSKQELKNLYDHYNKKLFDGKCLPLDNINFSRSKKVVAWATFLPKTRKSKLKFNSAYLKSNPKYIIDTLIHEMIHCYQYGLMYDAWDDYIKGDAKAYELYTEIRDELTAVTQRTSKGVKGTGGHDKIFKTMMHKINALGYNVVIREHGTELLDMHTDHYVLLFFSRSEGANPLVGGYSHSSPFKNNIPDILDKLKKLYGPTFASYYAYGKSNHSFTSQTVPLTAKGTLPTSIGFKWYSDSNSLKALKEFKPEVKEKLMDEEDPMASFKRRLTVYSKDRYKLSFTSYIFSVLYATIVDNGADILNAYTSGQYDRVKTLIQDRYPERYKLLHEEYNNIDTKHFLKINAKSVRQLMSYIWKLHGWLKDPEYQDSKKELLTRLYDEYKYSEFRRLDVREFTDILTAKLKKEYPIPASDIELYMGHLINDKW